MAVRTHSKAVPLPRRVGWRGLGEQALLACGIVAPLVYAASDVIAGLRWQAYSFRDQTISELNALGSPTRHLTIGLGLVGYSFLIAFGVGVWKSASRLRGRPAHRLRVAGGTLVAFGAISLWAVPLASMHVREAETSLSDTLHLVEGMVAAGLLLVVIGSGASTLGTRFRVYSIFTVLVTLAFVGWSGMDGARIADNLPTPWVGVKERIGIYSYQLWLVAFAIALLRQRVPVERTDTRTCGGVS